MFLEPQSITSIGVAHHRYNPVPFGIKQTDRQFHVYAIGQTGTGKSVLLHNFILQDVRANRGACLIEPHGDLAEMLRPKLSDQHIYWDVADPASPYGYNPLLKVSAMQRPLVASGLIDVMKHQWGVDGWGPRMEHLLRYSLLALSLIHI